MRWLERFNAGSVWLLTFVAVGAFAIGRNQLFVDGVMDWSEWLLLAAGAVTVCEMLVENRWFRRLSSLIQVAAGVYVLTLEAHFLTAAVAVALFTSAFINLRERPQPRSRRNYDATSDDDDEPMQSIVLLMKEPKYLDATILTRLASDAWGMEVVRGEEEEEDEFSGAFQHGQWSPRRQHNREDLSESPPTLYGEEAPFMCLYWPALLVVHNTSSPYFENIEEVIADIEDPHVARAVRKHQAWLSVDLVSWMDEGEPRFEAVDRLIGQLLAELADEEDCLAVIDLIEGQIYPFDSKTTDKLLAKNPREALSRDYFLVPEDDAEMQRAVAQAKRRWPEFVTAFEQRDDTEHFNVKAKFAQNGAVEYIWVAVTAIEADIIYGELGNEPVHVGGKLGDRVRVPLDDLSDWLHVSAKGVRSGGFTIEVLSKRRQDDNDR